MPPCGNGRSPFPAIRPTRTGRIGPQPGHGGGNYLGLPEKNPFKAVERFGEDKRPRYVPSEEDFWKVFQAAETEQDRAMLLAYLHTAARRSEVLNPRWDDLDFANSRLRLWTKKRQGGGREFDWIPMTADLRTALF